MEGEKLLRSFSKRRKKLPEHPVVRTVKENQCPMKWVGRRGIVGEPYLSALPLPSRCSTPYTNSSSSVSYFKSYILFADCISFFIILKSKKISNKFSWLLYFTS